MIRKLSFPFLLVLFAAVSLAQETRVVGLLEGESLTLTARATNRVAGSFAHAGVQVAFDSVRTSNEVVFTLRTRDDRVIFHAQSDTKSYAIEFYGGELKATGTIVETVTRDGVSRLAAPKIAGDGALAKKFGESPEYKALPWLSRALAANGITGNEVPSSLYLHGIALSSAERNKIVVPDVVVPMLNARPAPCPDQRKDPCKNSCFGMCGPGCTCWKWVCGDCCMHVGCLTHDVTCRLCDCSITNFADCVLCYTAISFLGAHPCTVIQGCQNPPKC